MSEEDRGGGRGSPSRPRTTFLINTTKMWTDQIAGKHIGSLHLLDDDGVCPRRREDQRETSQESSSHPQSRSSSSHRHLCAHSSPQSASRFSLNEIGPKRLSSFVETSSSFAWFWFVPTPGVSYVLTRINLSESAGVSSGTLYYPKDRRTSRG